MGATGRSNSPWDPTEVRFIHRFNPSWVPPAGLINTIRTLGWIALSFNPSWVPPAGLMQPNPTPGPGGTCFNPSWVPPAGLILLLAWTLGSVLMVSIPHGCHRPV